MLVIVTEPLLGQSARCGPILRSLPEWFGIELSTAQYIQDIETLPTVMAVSGDKLVGFLAITHHSPFAAEIHVMGVLPEVHRQGIGRALIGKAEAFLRSQGILFLQVKTLSSAHPSKFYARTRQFYNAMGFKPLQEFPELWGTANPCLQMVKWLG